MLLEILLEGVPMFLSISGIRKSFGKGENRIEVLKGVDLEIAKGEFCVLLGPSGSGKSTLLNIIGGIDRARIPGRSISRGSAWRP